MWLALCGRHLPSKARFGLGIEDVVGFKILALPPQNKLRFGVFCVIVQTASGAGSMDSDTPS